jgi:hypothetical protein
LRPRRKHGVVMPRTCFSLFWSSQQFNMCCRACRWCHSVSARLADRDKIIGDTEHGYVVTSAFSRDPGLLDWFPERLRSWLRAPCPGYETIANSRFPGPPRSPIHGLRLGVFLWTRWGKAGARFAANRCERTTGRAAAYRLYRAGLHGNNTCAAPMIDSSTPRSCRGFTPHYRAGLVERSKRWTVKRYFDRSSTPRLIRPTILDPQILDDNPLIETNQAPPVRSSPPLYVVHPQLTVCRYIALQFGIFIGIFRGRLSHMDESTGALSGQLCLRLETKPMWARGVFRAFVHMCADESSLV